jgi:hypothetical protein
MFGNKEGRHMDALERQQLQERTFEEVRRMLEEGDINYLMGFNRAGLIGALEDELRFLGLYYRDDRESPAFIHALLEEHLDELYDRYLRPRVQETQQNPEPVVQIEKAPWVVFFTAGAGALRDNCTQYYDFRPLQVKHISA